MPLDPDVKTLATRKNYAALTTLFADGRPQTNIMWVDADDEHLLINTETGRVKFRNMQHDPRVSVTIWDRDDPHRYIEVRGRVVDTLTGPQAHEHLDRLSEKYRGKPYEPSRAIDRVIVAITPERVVKRNI